MVTSNRTVINDSDSYVLCWQGKYEDVLESKFFAIMLDNNGFVRYGFKSTERSCSKLYPKSNKIRHKSKYSRPYFKKQNISEVEKRQLQVLHFLLNYKYRGFPNNNSLPTVSLNMINGGSVRYLGL